MGTKESDLITIREDDLQANDFVRVLDSASSRKITLQDFSESQESILESLGFLKAISVPSIPFSQSIVTITNNHNLTLLNGVILVDSTVGIVNINLMPALAAFDLTNLKGQIFTIKRVTGDVNTVTLNANGAELIDGTSAFSLVGPSLVSVAIISDGSNWSVI